MIPKTTFKNLGLDFPFDDTLHKGYINLLTFDNTNYKKAYKTNLKIYNRFNFDTLLFKIKFINNDIKNNQNLEKVINTLNRFIDICKLKKPAYMQKFLYKNENNIVTETIVFGWNLNNEKIKIKDLIKQILFLEDDNFYELISSVYFLDTKNDTLLHFYDDKIIKILTQDEKTIKKLLKNYKNIIIN